MDPIESVEFRGGLILGFGELLPEVAELLVGRCVSECREDLFLLFLGRCTP